VILLLNNIDTENKLITLYYKKHLKSFSIFACDIVWELLQYMYLLVLSRVLILKLFYLIHDLYSRIWQQNYKTITVKINESNKSSIFQYYFYRLVIIIVYVIYNIEIAIN
jgi:hypothetical protein